MFDRCEIFSLIQVYIKGIEVLYIALVLSTSSAGEKNYELFQSGEILHLTWAALTPKPILRLINPQLLPHTDMDR